MKQFEKVNALSEGLINDTKLKRGETKQFVVAGITPHPWTNELIVPSVVTVPPVDQIQDPNSGEWVDIAAISRIEKDGKHGYHELTFYGHNAGRIILSGGRGADQEVYAYLKLSNFNGSNPNRDESKPIYYYEVDEAKKAEQDEKIRDIKREALNSLADLSAADVRDYAASLGLDDKLDLKILRNKLGDLADKDPKAFNDLLSDKTAVIKATINRSIRDGKILFDAVASKYTWPHGEEILRVPRAEDAVDELAGYLATNPKGEKVLTTLMSKGKK